MADPVPTNPFEPYLGLYRPGACPTRPWWWWPSNLLKPKVGLGSSWNGLRYRRSDLVRFDLDIEGMTTEECMAFLDATQPVPPPPPMSGQTWVIPGDLGELHIVGLSGLDGAPLVFHPLHFPPGCPGILQRWPPPGAVLVAGPTPWGRDVPWAPSTYLPPAKVGAADAPRSP